MLNNNNLKNQNEEFRNFFELDLNGNLTTNYPIVGTSLTVDTINADQENINNRTDYEITGFLHATGDVIANYGQANEFSLTQIGEDLQLINPSKTQNLTAVSRISQFDGKLNIQGTQPSKFISADPDGLNNYGFPELKVGRNEGGCVFTDYVISEYVNTGTINSQNINNTNEINTNSSLNIGTTGTSGIMTLKHSDNNNIFSVSNLGVSAPTLNASFKDVIAKSGNFRVENATGTTVLQIGDNGNITANSILFPGDYQISGSNASLPSTSVQSLSVNAGNTIINNGITTSSTVHCNRIELPNGNYIDGSTNQAELMNCDFYGVLTVQPNIELNPSGTITASNINVTGPSSSTFNTDVIFNNNVYFNGGSITSQSVINQFTSMSILQNPAGNVPALSIIQGGGTNAIFEVTDADSNIKFQINQDCDVNINDKINMDSATGNITSLGTLNCSAINVGNNFTSNATSSQFINDTYIGDNGVEVLTAESPSVPVLPSTYNGTVYQIHNETELTNAIASAVDFDILELRGDITLTATANINKNLKLTSHNTRRFISFNGLNGTTINWTGQDGYIDNVEIRSLGQGSNEIGLYLNNQSGNFVVNNCLLNVDEFGISCNVNSFIIRDSTFNYARLPANESMRYIQLLKTGANSVNYIHNNVFNGIASGDASIQCISTVNAGLNAFPSSTFSITNNTSSGIVQRLFMMDSTNMLGNNCTWYLMNNSLTCSSGFYIWYHPSALVSQVAFYCSGNTETLGGSATGSKGLIGLDSIGSISSVNYSCKFFGKNNNIPALRADYSDLSQNSSRVIAYNNTKLTPTQTFDTIYYDNVNIDGLLNVNSNASFTKNVSITGSVSASNLSGTNTGDQNVLSSLSVSGQTTISMVGNQTLNISSGSGISLTTDNVNKVLTITGTPSQNTFTQINVSGQTSLTANTTTTQLNLIAGTGMSILTDDITKSITLNSTGGGGSGPSYTQTADTWNIPSNFNQAPSITNVNASVGGKNIVALCMTDTYAIFTRSFVEDYSPPYPLYVYSVNNGTLTLQNTVVLDLSPTTTVYGMVGKAVGNSIFIGISAYTRQWVLWYTYNNGSLINNGAIFNQVTTLDGYICSLDYKIVYNNSGINYGILTFFWSPYVGNGYQNNFYAFWHNTATNSFSQITNPTFNPILDCNLNRVQVVIAGSYNQPVYEILLYNGVNRIYELTLNRATTSTPTLTQYNTFTFSNNFPNNKYDDVSGLSMIVDDEDTLTNLIFLHLCFPYSSGDTGTATGGCFLSYRYLSGFLNPSLDNSQIWQLDDLYTLQTNSQWGGRWQSDSRVTNNIFGFVKDSQLVIGSTRLQGIAQIKLTRSASIPYLQVERIGNLLYPFNDIPTQAVANFKILGSPNGQYMVGCINNASGDTAKRIFIYQKGSAGTTSILWQTTSSNIETNGYIGANDTTGLIKLPVRTLASVQDLRPALLNGFSFIDSTSGTIKVYYNGTFKTITWT